MISVFVSYAHADERLKEQFLVHLAALKRQGLVGVWHDRMLKPGQHLDSAIEAKLAAANLVILLVSPDFINSDYCIEKEMQRAFARAKQGQCKVAAIILRPCQWREIPIDSGGQLGDFLATPGDGKPVTQWSNRDAAWDSVVADVRGLINDEVKPTDAFSLPADATARPRFEPQFMPERDIHRDVRLFNSATGQQLPIKATYVLVRVVTVGNANVENCSGWITRLEKLDGTTKTSIETLQGSRQLIWSPREAQTLYANIRPEVPQDLDVFRSVEGVNSVELMSIGHPPSWDAFFSLPGTYRLTVVISAKGTSRTKRLLINWRGIWNDFDVEVAQN
jgi:TIR domain